MSLPELSQFEKVEQKVIKYGQEYATAAKASEIAIGMAGPTMAETRASLLRAVEQAITNAAIQQRGLMRRFMEKVETKYGKMEEPKMYAEFWGGNTIKGAFPGLLSRNTNQIIKYGEVVDAAVAVERNIEFMLNVYRYATKRAVELPPIRLSRSGKLRYDRTYAHSVSFALGVAKDTQSSAVVDAMPLNNTTSVKQVENFLGTVLEIGPKAVFYLFNSIEYAASLESYFDQKGKGGILYEAFNRFNNTNRGSVSMRYTNIHPDRLRRDFQLGVNRVRNEGTSKVSTYRYVMPAIAFGAPGALTGRTNSRPGFKLGRGGRLTRKKNRFGNGG